MSACGWCFPTRSSSVCTDLRTRMLGELMRAMICAAPRGRMMAVLTVATPTVATLAMALLTMAMLTVAMLKVALFTVAPLPTCYLPLTCGMTRSHMSMSTHSKPSSSDA